MKRHLLLFAGLFFVLSGQAQVDTTGKETHTNDTIRVGNILIIKDGGGGDRDSSYNRNHSKHKYHRHDYTPSNITTNWLILDIGFANYNDKTDYASAGAQQFAPGSTSDWFRLNTGKSVDVNIWAFMQRLNLIKHVVNLKYGLGIELNNYRYDENIRYLKNPTRIIMDTINYSKNKLAVDYVTVPFMLNFNFTPGREQEPYGFSVGASVGYRYSSRQKLISGPTGKFKTYNDFDLEPWKISWIGEIHLGMFKFYGSYATKSMFHKGLDQVPYTVGIRLSYF